MKKLFTLLLILLSCWTVDAQSRLGFSPQEIRQEFSDEEFTSGYTKEGNYFIYLTKPTHACTYTFNSDMKCIMTCVFVQDNSLLNALVERYNREYVIINNYTWKWYTPYNYIVNVQLVKVEDTPVFVYKLDGTD